MRVVGIIAEYNPFHSGHSYHLSRAKALAGADYAIAVMSGDFVQRGEPAMFPKKLRTKWALENGADLVISLPVAYSLTSAYGFAKGAVRLLQKSGVVDALCFGSESGDISLISKALSAQDDPERSFALRQALKEGQSYPAACQSSLIDLPTGPNDILGIEYLRALNKLGSSIEPLALKREGAVHDQVGLSGAHASATALRGRISAGDLGALSNYLSCTSIDDIRALTEKGSLRYLSCLSQAILYALRRLSKEDLAALGEVREGLENTIYRACREAATVDELLALLKSRRYPMASLKRACLCALLGITGADLESSPDGDYIRILGVRRDATPLLSTLSQKTTVPVVSKFIDASLLNTHQRRLFDQDMFAAEIACLASEYSQPAPFDYSDPLLIID